jgi:diphosphomevalonate decarboxylase
MDAKEASVVMEKATAVANPNIAFIKYWGRIDQDLNLPANPSLSMNLGTLATVTTVEFCPDLALDAVMIDNEPATGQALARVVMHLERVRAMAGVENRARVISRNGFPAGAGLASSASAFAALSLAATKAVSLELDEAALSRLARMASGSACRSVPGGFSLWQGNTHESSFARQVASPQHWDLHDVVAIVSCEHKAVSSYEGHTSASSSPFFGARLAAVPALLGAVRAGIAERSLRAMGPAVEADALAMHAVMMTCEPGLLYWAPSTVTVLHAVRAWREEGLPVYFTMDAGPNVHCLCEPADVPEVKGRLRNLDGVLDVLSSGPGGKVRLVEDHLL